MTTTNKTLLEEIEGRINYLNDILMAEHNKHSFSDKYFQLRKQIYENKWFLSLIKTKIKELKEAQYKWFEVNLETNWCPSINGWKALM